MQIAGQTLATRPFWRAMNENWKKISAWNDAKQPKQLEGKSGFEIKNQLPNELVNDNAIIVS